MKPFYIFILSIFLVFFISSCKSTRITSYEEDIILIKDNSDIYIFGETIQFEYDLRVQNIESFNKVIPNHDNVYVVINYQNIDLNLSEEEIDTLEDFLHNDYSIIFLGIKNYVHLLENTIFLDEADNYSNSSSLLVSKYPDHIRRIMGDEYSPELLIYDMKQVFYKNL